MSLDRIRKFFGRKAEADQSAVDAQTYVEASTENAMRATDHATEELKNVRDRATATNERLSEGIERMRNAIPRMTVLDKMIQDAKGLHR